MTNFQPIYMHEFPNDAAIIDHFHADKDALQGYRVLLAFYEYDNYEGLAFVLFERNGKLYEVNGAICSCFDLEDQWEPEETTVASLEHRLNNGLLGHGYLLDKSKLFADELSQVIEYLKGNGP